MLSAGVHKATVDYLEQVKSSEPYNNHLLSSQSVLTTCIP